MRALFLAAVVAGVPAWAQEGPRWALMAQQNQLGLLEYCQAQGHVAMDVVERQRRALAQPGSAMEEAGRTGMIAYLEPQATLAAAAAASGTTIGYRCALMAYRVPDQ